MSYQFKLEFRKPDGRGVSVRATPDFAPALECCRWEAVERGLLAAGAAVRGAAVEPLWHNLGAPYVSGLLVRIETPHGAFTHSLTHACVTEEAAGLHARLVQAGYLDEEDEVVFSVTAWPSDTEMPLPGGRETDVDLPLGNGSIEALLARSRENGPMKAADIPVFIPSEVLAEVRQAARQATPLEIGGVLIGHLHRSGLRHFARITAAVPAIDAVSSETDLRFTPAAWATVRAAVDLRRQGELILSWYHSHPVRAGAFGKCATCPPEKQRLCEVATALFSPQDRLLHKAIFPRAFSIGLVANDLSQEVVFSIFGWRGGVITQRGFYELDKGEPLP